MHGIHGEDEHVSGLKISGEPAAAELLAHFHGVLAEPAAVVGARVAVAVHVDGAVGALDWPVAMGVVIITAGLTIVANFVADVAYVVVDPRIRY